MHLVLALALQLQVVGLGAGESFQELAEMAEPANPYQVMHGRVLNAFTGRPLAGAKIETWSEEIDNVFGGFHRLGEARSGRDGRFTVIQKVGSQQASKSRISAPGFLTWSGGRGDLYTVVRLFPRMKYNPRIRVLDLAGRPIQGARITSTYTCAHDVPAFDLLTGADGIAEFTEFGLQDDVQELRVRAPGFLAIKYLEGEPMFEHRHLDKPFDVFLPRQRTFRFTLLDRDGEISRDTPVKIRDDEGYIVERTDENGLVEITAQYGDGDLSLLLIVPSPQSGWVTGLTPLTTRVPAIRINADVDPEDWPDGTESGKVFVDLSALEGEPGYGPSLQFFHEAGWMRWASRLSEGMRVATVPAGKGFLHVGGVFTPFKEEFHDFEVVAGMEIKIRPTLTLEPTIEVVAPEEGDWTLLIQAGEDSKLDVPFGEQIYVPAGRELILVLEGEGNRVQKVIDQVTTGMIIDFDEVLLALPDEELAVELIDQELRFVSKQTGKPVAGSLRSHSRGDFLIIPEDEEAQAEFKIRGPLGSQWLACFETEGYNPIFLRGRIAEGNAPLSFQVEALASLEIKAPFAYEILGNDPVDLLEFNALPPGPLELVLLREDGRRYGLILYLEPGAKRVIEIR